MTWGSHCPNCGREDCEWEWGNTCDGMGRIAAGVPQRRRSWLSHYRRQSGRDLLCAALGGLLLAVLIVTGGLFLMVVG